MRHEASLFPHFKNYVSFWIYHYYVIMFNANKPSALSFASHNITEACTAT